MADVDLTFPAAEFVDRCYFGLRRAVFHVFRQISGWLFANQLLIFGMNTENFLSFRGGP